MLWLYAIFKYIFTFLLRHVEVTKCSYVITRMWGCFPLKCLCNMQILSILHISLNLLNIVYVEINEHSVLTAVISTNIVILCFIWTSTLGTSASVQMNRIKSFETSDLDVTVIGLSCLLLYTKWGCLLYERQSTYQNYIIFLFPMCDIYYGKVSVYSFSGWWWFTAFYRLWDSSTTKTNSVDPVLVMCVGFSTQ